MKQRGFDAFTTEQHIALRASLPWPARRSITTLRWASREYLNAAAQPALSAAGCALGATQHKRLPCLLLAILDQALWPVVLLLLALRLQKALRAHRYCAAAGILVPVVLLPVVSIDRYFDFLAKLGESIHPCLAHIINGVW